MILLRRGWQELIEFLFPPETDTGLPFSVSAWVCK